MTFATITHPISAYHLLVITKDVGYKPLYKRLTMTNPTYLTIYAEKHTTTNPSTLALSLDTIQPWNLLASTQNLSGFTYKKLVILSSTEAQYMPTVLATKNSICYAFQPNATTIIRQTTQPTRPLLKLTTLPEGVNCE